MEIRRGRVVTFRPQLKYEFDKSFKEASSSIAKRSSRANVSIPVFNGEIYKNDGRGHNNVMLSVDFDTMSNYFGNSKYLGSAGPKDSELEGKSIDEIKNMLSPVYVDQFTDVTEADPNRAEKVRVSIDLKALAAANYAERMNNHVDGTPVPRPETADRLSVAMFQTNSHNGVAGMKHENICSNVAKCAQQQYMLTATQKIPDHNLVSQEDIRMIGELYMYEYDRCARAAMYSPFSYKDENGQDVVCAPFNTYGLKYVEYDGARVMGADPNKCDRDGIDKACREFDIAFNQRMKNIMTETFGYDKIFKDDAVAKKTTSMLNIKSYPTIPPHPGTVYGDVVLIQHAMRATIQPFSGALQKAYDAAMHEGPNGVSKTPQELYGDEILKNAHDITKRYEMQFEAEEFSRMQIKQYDGVAALILGGDDGPPPPGAMPEPMMYVNDRGPNDDDRGAGGPSAYARLRAYVGVMNGGDEPEPEPGTSGPTGRPGIGGIPYPPIDEGPAIMM